MTDAGGRPCENCGHVVATGLSFCVECGHRMPGRASAPSPPPEAARPCAACHEPVALGFRFCENCGSPMPTATGVVEAASGGPAPPARPPSPGRALSPARPPSTAARRRLLPLALSLLLLVGVGAVALVLQQSRGGKAATSAPPGATATGSEIGESSTASPTGSSDLPSPTDSPTVSETPTVATTPQVPCWDGSTADSKSLCPRLTGVESLAWAYPSLDLDSSGCAEIGRRDLPSGAVAQVVCTSRQSGSRLQLVFREWASVAAGTAFFEDYYGSPGTAINGPRDTQVFAQWSTPGEVATRLFVGAPFSVSAVSGSTDPVFLLTNRTTVNYRADGELRRTWSESRG